MTNCSRTRTLTTRTPNGMKRPWLLPKKDSYTYTKLWRMIKAVYPALHPDTFSADYEIPAIKAVLEAFPDRIRFLGCAFHFRYSLDKQAEERVPLQDSNMRLR